MSRHCWHDFCILDGMVVIKAKVEETMKKDNIIQAFEKDLNMSLAREASILQEMLRNMQEEQHALLINNYSLMQQSLSQRVQLINALQDQHTKLNFTLRELIASYYHEENIEEQCLLDLIERIEYENGVSFTSKNQMRTLIEKIERQNRRNNFLLTRACYQSC
jgi:hypothetical protein